MKPFALSVGLVVVLAMYVGCTSTPPPGQMDCRALTAGGVSQKQLILRVL